VILINPSVRNIEPEFLAITLLETSSPVTGNETHRALSLMRHDICPGARVFKGKKETTARKSLPKGEEKVRNKAEGVTDGAP
jgi:hypothetical protein